MKRAWAIGAVLLVVAPARSPAQADGSKEAWGLPITPYVADMVFTNDRGRSRIAKLYYTPKRQRLEYRAGQEIVAVVFDQVANRAYQLLLNGKGWRPIRVARSQFSFGISDPKAKRKILGTEKMAGMTVTKFQVSAKSDAGDEFDGTAWATRGRIILKIVGMVARGRLKQRLTMVLQNLKIGPVDPALFAVPKDYKKLPPIGKKR